MAQVIRLGTVLCFLLFTAGIAHAQISSVQSGNWSDVNTWSGGVVPTAGDDVTISEGHEVSIDTDVAAANNVVVNGTLQYPDVSGNHITVNGHLTVAAGGTFRASPGGLGNLNAITLHGDLTSNGTLQMRGSGNSAVNISFEGTDHTNITVGTYPSEHNFSGVTINKSGGGRVILHTDAVQHHGSSVNRPFLNLQNGILQAGEHSFIVTGTGSEGDVMLGGSSDSYVIGGLGRGFRTSAGTSIRRFPVGDESGYRPFETRMVFPSGETPATGHYLDVRVVPGDADTGTSTLEGDLQRVSTIRYYEMEWTEGFSTSAVDLPVNRLRPTYGGDDGVSEGNNDLRVASSQDARETWTSRGGEGHTTDLSNPPTEIRADASGDDILFTVDANSTFFVALATTDIDSNPLPVELLSFTAAVDGSDAVLRWSVAREQNNAGFQIERRVDNAFQPVGFVEGRGTTSEPGEYSYRVADLSPGVHAFRLRQVDFGGSFAYSPTVELTVEVPGDFMLSAPYPNPFNPQTTLEFAVAHSQPVIAVLYDALGRQVTVLYDGTPAANEMQTLRVDGTGLTSGLYFVRLEGESFTALRRLVLVK